MSQKLPCQTALDTSVMDSPRQGQNQEGLHNHEPNHCTQETLPSSLNELACVEFGMKQIESCNPEVLPASKASSLNDILPTCFQNNFAQKFQFAFGCGEFNQGMNERALQKKRKKEQTQVAKDENTSIVIVPSDEILEKDNNCTTSMYKRNPPAPNDPQAAFERQKIIKSYKRQLHINLDFLDQRDEIPLRRDTFSPRHDMEDDDVTISTQNLSRHQQQSYDNYQNSFDRSTTPSYRKKLHQRHGWKTSSKYSNASSLDGSTTGTPNSNRQRLSMASKYNYDMIRSQTSPTKGRHIHEKEHAAPFSEDASMFGKSIQTKTPLSKKHFNVKTSIHSPTKMANYSKGQRYSLGNNHGHCNNNGIKYHDASSIHDKNENDNLMFY